MSLGTSLRRLWSGSRWGHRATGGSHSQLSFSQEGEDRLVARLLDLVGLSIRKHRGFYVDVGAHHPMRFSNTYAWYLRGWSGINIDAKPGSMEPFAKLRPRDINLECGIAATEGTLQFSIFNEPALNTFDAQVAAQRALNPKYQLLKTVPVRTRPLASVLEEYLPQGKQIDLLSVDVEGLDLIVLQSNDWKRFRPLMVMAEVSDLADLHMATQCDVSQFLIGQGYVPMSKLVQSLCFVRADALSSKKVAA